MQDQGKLEKDVKKLLETLGAIVKKQIKIAEAIRKLFPEGTDVWAFDEQANGELNRWACGSVTWKASGKDFCLVSDSMSVDYGMTHIDDSVGAFTENPVFHLKVPVRPQFLSHIASIPLHAIKAYKLPDSNEVKLFKFEG